MNLAAALAANGSQTPPPPPVSETPEHTTTCAPPNVPTDHPLLQEPGPKVWRITALAVSHVPRQIVAETQDVAWRRFCDLNGIDNTSTHRTIELLRLATPEEAASGVVSEAA